MNKLLASKAALILSDGNQTADVNFFRCRAGRSERKHRSIRKWGRKASLCIWSALSLAASASPSLAAVTVVNSKQALSSQFDLTSVAFNRSNISSGGASFTQGGVTFSTINVGGQVRYTEADPYHGTSATISLIDNKFAIFGFGTFGFDFFSFSQFDLFVNGNAIDSSQATGRYLGFVSDDYSLPTVVTIALKGYYANFPGIPLSVDGLDTGTPKVAAPIHPVQPPPLLPSEPSAVPEPASWATIIGGLCLVGGLLRQRRESGRVGMERRCC